MSGDSHKDLYAVLGLDEKAGPEELRRAYLSLAVKYHPDRNAGDPEAEERFKDISQAYAVLSDPVARARYERLAKARRGAASPGSGSSSGSEANRKPDAGEAASGQSSAGTSSRTGSTDSAQSDKRAGAEGREAAGAGSGNSSEADFEDILNGFFKSARGRDLLKDLEKELNQAGIKFSFEDFTHWIKNRKISAATPARKPLWRRVTDWLTGAEGKARKEAARYDISYQLSLSTQAATTGTTVDISYPRDGGEHRLKIRIPGGAKDGSRLRLAGQGRLKADGSRGDLVLTVLVGPRQSVADLWK